MNYTILDASLAGLFELILVVTLLVITVVEWIVMLLMKFSTPGKSLLYSFLANLASLAAGYIFSRFSIDIGLAGENYSGLLIGYVVSVVIEALLIQAISKGIAPKKVWLTSVVMNTVTYIGLFIILNL
ncbi:MAG TPA: hypothetical protein VLJ68_01545 [Chitinophagaceae bacterium]|nr:hypothetical protein [Chitinophagaceae bacterium]